MRIPRLLYFMLPAFLTELALFMTWIATPIYAIQRFEADAAMLGLMGALTWGCYGAVAVFAGWLSDRTGRMRWLGIGLAASGATILLMPQMPSLGLLMLTAILSTAMLGFFWAPLQSMLSETTTPRRLIRELMVFNLGWSCGTILASSLVTYCLKRGNPDFIFYMAGIFMLLSMVLVLAFRPRVLPLGPNENLTPDPRAPRLKLICWVALFGNFFLINMLIYVFPKIALTPDFAMSEASIGQLQLVRTCALASCFVLMALCSMWRFRLWPLHLCFGLMLLLTTLIASSPGFWGLALAFAALGVTGAASYAMSAFYSMLSVQNKGATMGMHELLLSSGNMLGPLVAGGVLQATGNARTALLSAVAPLLGIWMVALWLQMRRGSGPH